MGQSRPWEKRRNGKGKRGKEAAALAVMYIGNESLMRASEWWMKRRVCGLGTVLGGGE